MKKILILAALFGTITTSTMAMPDVLLETGSFTPTTTAVDSYTAVPNQDTVKAVKKFADTWVYTNRQLEIARKNEANGTLSDLDRAWLKFGRKHNPAKLFSFHLEKRLEFYKRAHNWNAENKDNRYYNYTMQPGQNPSRKESPDKGYTNSYGWNILHEEVTLLEEAINNTRQPLDAEAITNVLVDKAAFTGQPVSNEELRYYLNEILWFSASQTTKELTRKAPEPLTN